MNNGQKPKCVIQIVLEEDGAIHFTSSSPNLITVFGLLEMAKVIATQPKKEESPILRPTLDVGLS